MSHTFHKQMFWAMLSEPCVKQSMQIMQIMQTMQTMQIMQIMFE